MNNGGRSIGLKSDWSAVIIVFLGCCRVLSLFAKKQCNQHSQQPLDNFEDGDKRHPQPQSHGSSQCVEEIEKSGKLFGFRDLFDLVVLEKDVGLQNKNVSAVNNFPSMKNNAFTFK